MLNQEAIRRILLEEFTEAQIRNPRCSMRSFAKRVGISQAAISQILSGKRPVSTKSAKKILTELNRSPLEVAKLQLEKAKRGFKSVDMDTYHLIADWHYFAILSLVETDDFNSSPSWIAQRLNISERLAAEAIERLVRLNLLKQKGQKLYHTGDQLTATSAFGNSALRKANRQSIELAEKALNEIDTSERDFSSITLCFDSDRIEEAREELKKFRRHFCKVFESGKKNEVFKLNLQLFPLTKKRST